MNKEQKKDSGKKEFEEFVKQSIFKLIKEMRLGELTVNVRYEYEKNRHEARFNRAETIFMINYVKPYKRIVVIICKGAYDIFRDKGKDEIWDGLIHEMCHIHTNQLMELAHERYPSKREIDDAVEELTETMAQYVRELMDFRARRDAGIRKNK